MAQNAAQMKNDDFPVAIAVAIVVSLFVLLIHIEMSISRRLLSKIATKRNDDDEEERVQA